MPEPGGICKAAWTLVAGMLIGLTTTESASAHVVEDRGAGRLGDQWAAEKRMPFVLATGAWTGTVAPESRGFGGPPRHVDSYGVNMRMYGYVAPAFYLGFEWGLGLGSEKPHAADASFPWMHMKTGPLIGTRIPLGRASLRFEVQAGMEMVGLSPQPTQPKGPSPSPEPLALLLEPRAALDLWLTPSTTLSLWGGTNVLHTADRSLGLSIGFHLQPYDGKFSL